MGFIESEPAGGDDGGATAEEPVTGGEEPTSNDNAPADPALVAEAPKTERVSLSRKQAAIQKRENFERQLSELKETFTKHGSETAAAIAARDAEIARLRGGFDVLAPLIQRQQQAAAPPPPDPNALMREAKKALDDGDFDLYQNKLIEAAEVRVMARLPQQQPQAQAPAANPVVTAIMGQFPAVLAAGDRGIQLAIIKDQELQVMGYPNGTERYRKAFELASNMLQPNSAPTHSQQSRQVLSGIPPARGGSGGSSATKGEAGVNLTAYELSVAEKCGMTREEYAKYVVESDPKRLER